MVLVECLFDLSVGDVATLHLQLEVILQDVDLFDQQATSSFLFLIQLLAVKVILDLLLECFELFMSLPHDFLRQVLKVIFQFADVLQLLDVFVEL